MKVLQLCLKPPFPVIDGGCIAISTISSGLLSKNIDLKILTASTEKHPFDPANYSQVFLDKTRIEGIFLDTRVNIIDAFSALVTADTYNVSRFFSADFDKRVRELLEEEKFDIIHLESLFMTPYIPTIRKCSSGKIVLRSHNLEHLIWERLANSTGNKAKKIYLKHLAGRLKKYEYKIMHDVDGIAAISFEDTQRYKKLTHETPLITIPFGVELNKYPQKTSPVVNRLKLFHIGAMNWAPNEEAINWFLDEIWPKISDLPIELHLAGRAMPDYLKNQASDQIIIHGEIDSAIEFMGAYDAMIVPLLSGSGMRIKIIEGMALGKAVISTSVGAEGISYTDNENIIICDEGKDFRKKIAALVETPTECERIGRNARKLVEDSYDNDRVIQKLIDFYEKL